jgi:TPP-dependent pyruvate/acetoin dehydrogenase alpha subunit
VTTTTLTPADRSVAEKLEAMLLIRTFEERMVEIHQSGKGPGTCTSVGQEASAVGVVSVLKPQDKILTNHRSAGHLLARGADPGRVMAEIQGKSTGYCGGKSGSLHISAKELGVVLTSTIVGGELSLATGVGLSTSMQKTDGIVVVFFGDGAATEGIFHESLNLASVWNLPILYVCENNQWQAFVRRDETMNTDHVSDWASRYGMPVQTVDGNDVEAVAEAARNAAQYVREQRKPFLLETYTYRLRGHYEPDDQAYVNKDELAAWKKKDPITSLENQLAVSGLVPAAELAAIRARVTKKIDDAVAFAAASPYPSFDEMTTDVYA